MSKYVKLENLIPGRIYYLEIDRLIAGEYYRAKRKIKVVRISEDRKYFDMQFMDGFTAGSNPNNIHHCYNLDVLPCNIVLK